MAHQTWSLGTQSI
uniref:Uncharacterized protein n=1 Tax=Arundo donax TaxID=35708 RepID=A0A0A9U5M7_ARUDO